MSEEESKVSSELFKDVKFYVVGDIDQKVVQLLKSGKGKEVSYNALATHIIAEDGDNPEVGESREVFDLPVVKAKFECALKHPGIKIVTPDWITDSVKDKNKKDEALYHPRLTYVEPEEEEESEEESCDQHSHSDGSYSPRRSRLSSGGSSGEESSPRRRPGPKKLNSVSPTSPHKPERRSERMFDDSDDDFSTEKEGTNLNWTPAEVTTPTPPIPTGTARRRVGPPGSKDPVSSTGSGLINLCATVHPVTGGGGAMPAEARSAAAAISHTTQTGVSIPEDIPGWSPAARTLRNITNNSDMQPANRPANVPHIIQNLTANQTKPLEQQTNQSHAHTANTTNPLLFNQSKLLFGHEPGQDVPQDGFLLSCVFAIADYPEHMADKQLLATWKRALREGKRCVTAHWLNTVLKRKKMVPPHRTLHLPFAFPPGAKPCSQHILSVTGFVDADRDDLKLMAYLAGARYTGYLCRSNTVLICKEPSGLKYEKAKEWKIPCVNAQWLCDILLGNFEALRQIQHSRYSIYNHPEPLVPNPQLVQNLLAAWRAPVKVSPEALASLQLLQKQKMTDSTNQPANKKARLEEIQSPSKKLPPESIPRVMFTGFEPTQVQQYTKRLHALGGEVADSSQKVTHLVASKVTRTVKFLTAMSVVKHIISPEWLEESWRSQKFVDEQSYTLRDAEAEVLFNFSLEESLKRANSAPLFKGKYFYLTPGICPSLSTMKSILESAGGKLLAKQPSYRKIMEHKQNKNLPEIILISCDNDLHLCREYFLKNIDVHNAEFILTGVLTQKLNYDSYPLQPIRAQVH
ncbi:PAX-interacting protein 1 PAX transactivation activation domain-interacting protein [Collichthys lucidus]|uniref:PAX-interacting protein 1 n=1 Tax=Collichthys lucidus TaxID=240159 RepID=A0A4U5UYL1_COLLU|nr:PAX-interacting protein 1 PAX transactivation activation domain-interacting protein [Collichthys lucidus]